MRARISAPVHTGPERTELSIKWVPDLFPGVKRQGGVLNHSPPYSVEVKGRVELYLYSPSKPSWPLLGWTFFVRFFFTYFVGSVWRWLIRGAQIFQNSAFWMLDARRVTWSKFHIEDPQTLGATVQNLVPRTTWILRFVQPWFKISRRNVLPYSWSSVLINHCVDALRLVIWPKALLARTDTHGIPLTKFGCPWNLRSFSCYSPKFAHNWPRVFWSVSSYEIYKSHTHFLNWWFPNSFPGRISLKNFN